MSEANSNQMLILFGFVAFLTFVVVGVIIFSQIKKDKKKTELDDQNSKNLNPPAQNLSSGPVSLAEDVPASEIIEISAGKPSVQLVRATDQADAPVETEPNLESALKKTEENFFGRIRRAFLSNDKKDVLEAVEEILYTSDLGPTTVQKLLGVIEEELSGKEMSKIETVKAALREQMIRILEPVHREQKSVNVVDLVRRAPQGPTVLMIVGVNGAGKTTSIGKMTAQLASQNFKVLVAAGDTFRAAAGGQLKTWTDRASSHSSAEGAVEIYWPNNTTDPSAVAFDAITKAKSLNFDFVILDTAGRLHTQAPLMDELKKVKRVMAKVIADAPHETWIVLDANSGQNALIQAKEFNQALGLSGVILTKMDGTAKGGVALGVVDQLQVPIKLVGIGEKINHLKAFQYEEYVDSILGKQ